MKIFNIIILIITTITISVYAQNGRIINSEELNTPVLGYVIHNGQTFIATGKGFVPIGKNQDINNSWQDYYRKIYNDSTIVNPNTVIGEQKQQIPMQFLAPVDISKWTSQSFSFTKQLYLYDFIQIDSTGNFVYKPGVLGILGSLKQNPGLKLPKIK